MSGQATDNDTPTATIGEDVQVASVSADVVAPHSPSEMEVAAADAQANEVAADDNDGNDNLAEDHENTANTGIGSGDVVVDEEIDPDTAAALNAVVDAAEVEAQASRKEKCFICREDCDPSSILQIDCPTRQHWMCYDCAPRIFEAVINNERNYPPRCCPKIKCLYIDDFTHILKDDALVQRYIAKMEEYRTHVIFRRFCSERECGHFLSTNLYKDVEGLDVTVAECSNCHKTNCISCTKILDGNNPRHTCVPKLPKGQVDYDHSNLRMKICPYCGEGIELFEGCNHITCQCDNVWCFECLLPWGEDHTQCLQYNDPVFDQDGYSTNRGLHRDTGLDRQGFNAKGVNIRGLDRSGNRVPNFAYLAANRFGGGGANRPQGFLDMDEDEFREAAEMQILAEMAAGVVFDTNDMEALIQQRFGQLDPNNFGQQQDNIDWGNQNQGNDNNAWGDDDQGDDQGDENGGWGSENGDDGDGLNGNDQEGDFDHDHDDQDGIEDDFNGNDGQEDAHAMPAAEQDNNDAGGWGAPARGRGRGRGGVLRGGFRARGRGRGGRGGFVQPHIFNDWGAADDNQQDAGAEDDADLNNFWTHIDPEHDQQDDNNNQLAIVDLLDSHLRYVLGQLGMYADFASVAEVFARGEAFLEELMEGVVSRTRLHAIVNEVEDSLYTARAEDNRNRETIRERLRPADDMYRELQYSVDTRVHVLPDEFHMLGGDLYELQNDLDPIADMTPIQERIDAVTTRIDALKQMFDAQKAALEDGRPTPYSLVCQHEWDLLEVNGECRACRANHYSWLFECRECNTLACHACRDDFAAVAPIYWPGLNDGDDVVNGGAQADETGDVDAAEAGTAETGAW